MQRAVFDCPLVDDTSSHGESAEAGKFACLTVERVLAPECGLSSLRTLCFHAQCKLLPDVLDNAPAAISEAGIAGCEQDGGGRAFLSLIQAVDLEACSPAHRRFAAIVGIASGADVATTAAVIETVEATS